MRLSPLLICLLQLNFQLSSTFAQLFEERIGNATFTLFVPDPFVTFTVAKENCEQLNTTLARIDRQEEQERLAELIILQRLTKGIYIGVHDEIQDPETPEIGTERFTYIDGVNDRRDFFLQPFQDPWDEANPNNLDGSASCVK